MLDDWNKGELSSFLIEITRDILKFTDADGQPLLEKIRDTAGQVGEPSGHVSILTTLKSRIPKRNKEEEECAFLTQSSIQVDPHPGNVVKS